MQQTSVMKKRTNFVLGLWLLSPLAILSAADSVPELFHAQGEMAGEVGDATEGFNSRIESLKAAAQ